MSQDIMVKVGDRWMFHCPGCGRAHQVDYRWKFDGNVVRPTIHPSIFVHGDPSSPNCHSFVTDGQIQFLSDSTHALTGQTVPLPPWEAPPN